ncbi:MAG: transglutaminase domain-containing protein [bacterium]|nr:transglutaminase domain-containing protein [bacterium]
MRMNKGIRNYAKTGICLAVTSAMLFTGCSTNKTLANKTGPSTTESTAIALRSSNSNTLTLSSLREKYGQTTMDYADTAITVGRGDNVELTLDYNPNKLNQDMRECFAIYQDESLKYKVDGCSYEYDDASGKMQIQPPTFGVAEMMVADGSDISLSDLSGTYLHDDTLQDNWGNLDQLYLVQTCDLKTGENLKKPMIHIIKIKSELKKAPVVKYSSNKEGEAQISWNAVPGAKEYLLFTVVKTDKGIDNYTYVFARTKDTTWTAPNMNGLDGNATLMNEMFCNFISSEDDADAGKEDMNGDFFKTMQKQIGVIAVNETGASPISDLYPLKQYAKRLPNSLAYYANQADTDNLFRKSIGSLPAQASITMCDGSTSSRILNYDFDHVTINDQDIAPTITITATIDGTKFSREYTVAIDDVTTVKSELEAIKKRQEDLKNKGGSLDDDVTIDDDDSDTSQSPSVSEQPEETTNAPAETEHPATTEALTPTSEPETTKAPIPTQSGDTSLDGNTDLKVTANSALSEFIARSFLISAKTIDISAFTESQNKNIVVDAVQEANYQNPLAMGINTIAYDEINHILKIEYYDEPDDLEAKRQEVIKKSKEIISQIIKDGMSDLEKEIAINTYLCENATYDQAALENAQKNDFKDVDDEFRDSFTPYGILIKKTGVCASYAASFKVLADECGLESIVVTGNLNGNLSHAWNRVKIDNEWKTVDSTNNDNEEISNSLFNVPDSAINGVLTADDRYVMDEYLNDYTCKTDQDEYYHYTSKFFAKDAIADKFEEALGKEDHSILRTDYTISEEDFSNIAQSVAEGMKTKLKGYFWLGVIHLQK